MSTQFNIDCLKEMAKLLMQMPCIWHEPTINARLTIEYKYAYNILFKRLQELEPNTLFTDVRDSLILLTDISKMDVVDVINLLGLPSDDGSKVANLKNLLNFLNYDKDNTDLDVVFTGEEARKCKLCSNIFNSFNEICEHLKSHDPALTCTACTQEQQCFTKRKVESNFSCEEETSFNKPIKYSFDNFESDTASTSCTAQTQNFPKRQCKDSLLGENETASKALKSSSVVNLNEASTNFEERGIFLADLKDIEVNESLVTYMQSNDSVFSEGITEHAKKLLLRNQTQFVTEFIALLKAQCNVLDGKYDDPVARTAAYNNLWEKHRQVRPDVTIEETKDFVRRLWTYYHSMKANPEELINVFTGEEARKCKLCSYIFDSFNEICEHLKSHDPTLTHSACTQEQQCSIKRKVESNFSCEEDTSLNKPMNYSFDNFESDTPSTSCTTQTQNFPKRQCKDSLLGENETASKALKSSSVVNLNQASTNFEEVEFFLADLKNIEVNESLVTYMQSNDPVSSKGITRNAKKLLLRNQTQFVTEFIALLKAQCNVLDGKYDDPVARTATYNNLWEKHRQVRPDVTIEETKDFVRRLWTYYHSMKANTEESINVGRVENEQQEILGIEEVVTSPSKQQQKNKIFKCKLCKGSFQGPLRFRQHCSRKHSNIDKPFECSQCDESFKFYAGLNKHESTCH